MLKNISFFICSILFSLLTYAQKPTINSFSPTSGSISTEITISGNNFSNTILNNVVFIGGSKAKVTSSTLTSLKVLVPSGSSSQPITIINLESGLQTVSAKSFLITFKESENKDFTNESFEVTNKKIDNTVLIYSNLVDIDGDGKLDLIIVNSSKQTIELYRNISVLGKLDQNSFSLSAVFNIAISYLNYGLRKVEFADLDGDGKLDLIVPYIEQNKIAIYKNNSSAGSFSRQSFGNEIQISVVSAPTSMVIADLDDDGKPEIVCLGQSSGFSILKNISSKGILNSSSFQSKLTLFNTTLYSNQSIDVGDIDNDQKLDLLIGNKGGFSVFKNTSSNGIFSFDEKRIVSDYNKSYKAFLVDFDGDSKKDVVLNTFFGKGLEVYKNISTSLINFDTKLDFNTSNNLISLYLADVNGDTKPDIILSPENGNISVLPNIYNGSFNTNLFGKEIILNAQVDFNSTISGDIDGDGQMDIITADGSTNLFFLRNIIVGKPKITSINPTSAKKGESVTIYGKNFDHVTSVNFGGVNATSFIIKSSSEVTAVLADGESGIVKVKTTDGVDSISGFQFIGPPPLLLSTFSPSSGASNELITITGSGFITGNQKNILSVKFGGIAAKSFQVISSTSIIAQIGSGASGEITVSAVGLSPGKLPGFVFIPKPTIDNSSSSFSGRAGDLISIVGTNFTNTSSVEFGGVLATSFTIISPTLIKAILGDGESGQIKITTPFGVGISSPNFDFLYLTSPPIISDFYPKKANAGDTLTIKGNYFSLLTSKNYVYFGPVKAKIVSASINLLKVIVPTGATYGPISIATHKFIAYSNDNFILTFDKMGNSINSNSFGGKISLNYNDILPDSRFNVADINNDGLPEILFGHSGYRYRGSNPNPFSINKNLSSKGIFNFGIITPYSNNTSSALNTYDFAVADLDMNGTLDFYFLGKRGSAITTESAYNVELSYYDPFFSSYPNFIGNSLLANIAVNDMDKDGKPDLVYGIYGYKFLNVTLADFNNDGLTDVIEKSENSLNIYINNSTKGNISYKPKINFPVDGNPISISIGDLDEDGKMDIVVLNKTNVAQEGKIQIFKNTSITTLSFKEEINYSAIPMVLGKGCVQIGDVDGDGKIDLLVGLDSLVLFYKNIGNQAGIKFKDKVELPFGANQQILLCDYDGDGIPDISGANIISLQNQKPNSFFVVRNQINNFPLTSFSPNMGDVGTKIKINGSEFKNVKKITIGGVEQKKFVIDSDNLITLTTDTVCSGLITLESPSSISTSQGVFISVYNPKITPQDSIISFLGDSILLSKTPNLAYKDYYTINGRYKYFSFQWYNNNDVIPKAIGANLQVKQSGNYKLSIITETGEISSNIVNVSFLKELPVNNYTILINNVSCKGASNGSIGISSKIKLDTDLKIAGNGINKELTFNGNTLIENLNPGIYSLCLKLKGKSDPEKCYTINVTEPKDLSLYATLNPINTTVELKLTGGKIYNIQLNGTLYSTKENLIVLPINYGNNKLIITSDKPCQGIIERQFFVSNKPLVFPNPFVNYLKINIEEQNVNILIVEVYNSSGSLVYKNKFNKPSKEVELNLEEINITGNYTLKVIQDNLEKNYKLIKL
jgi:hypothetical protein